MATVEVEREEAVRIAISKYQLPMQVQETYYKKQADGSYNTENSNGEPRRSMELKSSMAMNHKSSFSSDFMVDRRPQTIMSETRKSWVERDNSGLSSGIGRKMLGMKSSERDYKTLVTVNEEASNLFNSNRPDALKTPNKGSAVSNFMPQSVRSYKAPADSYKKSQHKKLES